MEIPPIRKIANTNEENKIPNGLLRPNSATAIPSHPILGKLSEANACWNVPNPSITPPRPARPPEINIAKIIVFLALIPEYSAACLFSPTVFNSNPVVVLFIKSQTTNTAAIAMKIPPCNVDLLVN